MLQSSCTTPGLSKTSSFSPPAPYRPVSKCGWSEKTLWLMASSLRNTTLLPCATAITRGAKALFFCSTTFFAGCSAGIGPSVRFSVITAPPGPAAPPPLTVPSTVTATSFLLRVDVDVDVGVDGGVDGDGDGDVAGGSAAAFPAFARACSANGFTTFTIASSRSGTDSSDSQLRAAVA